MKHASIPIILLFAGCATLSPKLPDLVRAIVNAKGLVAIGNQTYDVIGFQALARQWQKGDNNAGVIIDAPDNMAFSTVGRFFEAAVFGAGIHRMFFAATRDGKEHLFRLAMPCPCPPPPTIVWAKIMPDGRLNYEVSVRTSGGSGRGTESKLDLASLDQLRQTLADTIESDPQLQVWLDMMDAGLHKHFIDTLYTCHSTGAKDVVFIVKESESPDRASEPSVAPAPRVQR